tara:strand:+ start:24067 stop:24597 length:531 start_codon:yes stop_codon:yes gene_type:complete
MKIEKTDIQDCLLIKPKIYKDNRGFFLETFQKERYLNDAKISLNFVQDNFSSSSKGVLRGLHFQKNKPQGKLIYVVKGRIYDVVVDIRKNSATFMKWIGVDLSMSNGHQLWIPPGLAHGFVTFEDANIIYKCTDYYDPDDECTLIWNDPKLNIDWKIENPKISEKDSKGLKFCELF